MLDWWEAALLSVAIAGAGGLIGLVTAYFTHRWTTSASRESEERQATRRVEDDQRKAERQYRRDRMKPIQDFLEIAKGYLAGQNAIGVVESMRANNVVGLGNFTHEELLTFLREKHPAPGSIELINGFTVAMSSASVPEISKALMDVWSALPTAPPSGTALADTMKTIREAEDAVDRYTVAI